MGTLLLAVAALGAAGCGTTTRTAQPPNPGQVFSGYLGHKAGVVEGFATWCMYCAYESKYHVKGWVAQVRRDHLGYVMVALDPRGSIGQAGPRGQSGAGGVDGPGVNGPALSASQMSANLAAYRNYYHLQGIPMLANPALALPLESLGFQGFPTFFFVNANGRIVHVQGGLLSDSQFTQMVQRYLLSSAKSP